MPGLLWPYSDTYIKYLTESTNLSQQTQNMWLQHWSTLFKDKSEGCPQIRHLTKWNIYVQQWRLRHCIDSYLAPQSVSLVQQIVLRGQLISSIFGSAWNNRMCQNMILGYQGAILVRSGRNTNSSTTINSNPTHWCDTNHAGFILLLLELYQGMYFYSIPLNIQSLSFCKMNEREDERHCGEGNFWFYRSQKSVIQSSTRKKNYKLVFFFFTPSFTEAREMERIMQSNTTPLITRPTIQSQKWPKSWINTSMM